MFPCACSLRSTQCAALIALAAAAGIMRIEPEIQRVPEQSAPTTQADSAARLPTDFVCHRTTLSAAALLPWVQVVKVAMEWDVAAADWPPVVGLSPTETCTGHHPATLALAPSARQHAFPYAVGPPHHDSHSNRRADDTWVSGDFAVRRTAGSGVAPILFPPYSARVSRTEDRATRMAGASSKPSFALRGKTGRFQTELSSREPAALRDHLPETWNRFSLPA